MEAVDSDGVDTFDNRSKETDEGGTAKGVVAVEPAAMGKDERGTGAEDDRVVFDDEDW